MTPKISIIIPCFNQEIFLEETLRSVFEQTYNNWECIIIDDGSTDNSASIAKSWTDRDSRFKLLQKPNGGLSSARNHGLDNASGDYIQFLDGDDLLYKDKLKACLIDHVPKDVTITSFDHLKNGEHLPPFCNLEEEFFTYNNILLQWDDTFSIPIHCGLFKKSLLDDFRFDQALKAGEDWLFWLFVFKKVPSTFFLNEVLVCYRLHEKSMTQDYDHMIANKQTAHLKILNSLDEPDKTYFFERFSLEALRLRATLMDIHKKHERRKERKLSTRIKRLFKIKSK